MESSVVVKTFQLVETLSREDGPSTLCSLAESSGIAKPTVHRLMTNLIGLGYVERVDTGRYALTNKLRSLCAGGSNGKLVKASEPFLTDLHNTTGETVNLGELHGDKIVYLRVIESPHPLRQVITAGETDQAVSTALGRAIIAHLPNNEQDRIFKNIKIKAQTSETILDIEKLRKVIKKVKKTGYAFERDENELGVTCFGAPIHIGSQVAAAISLSVPTARLKESDEPELINAITQAAAKISGDL